MCIHSKNTTFIHNSSEMSKWYDNSVAFHFVIFKFNETWSNRNGREFHSECESTYRLVIIKMYSKRLNYESDLGVEWAKTLGNNKQWAHTFQCNLPNGINGGSSKCFQYEMYKEEHWNAFIILFFECDMLILYHSSKAFAKCSTLIAHQHCIHETISSLRNPQKVKCSEFIYLMYT